MKYCKNCGKDLLDTADFCPACGTKSGMGNNYCFACGAQTNPGQMICTNCGTATNKTAAGTGGKSKLAAGLLGIFLGQLGIHNFYLGYTKRGVIQLVLTLAFCWTFAVPLAMWIWGLVEGIQCLTGKMVDANGNELVD
ncbi:MAG: TM2 domain-containing protein [Eubacterium sp.]|nr:TM2 domain-containing protein [Eubacterium sp.]